MLVVDLGSQLASIRQEGKECWEERESGLSSLSQSAEGFPGRRGDGVSCLYGLA